MTLALSLEGTLRALELRRDAIEGEYSGRVAEADRRRRDQLAELALEMLGAPGEVGLLRERHGIDERPADPPAPEVPRSPPRRRGARPRSGGA